MNSQRLAAVLIGTALLTAAACGDSAGDEGRDQASTGTPVTHDEQSTEEALFYGTLEGTLDCLWLTVGEERHALVLPQGSSTETDGDVVVLLAPGDDEIARTGDEVAVGGGTRPGVEACADADATEPTIVAGDVRRGTD